MKSNKFYIYGSITILLIGVGYAGYFIFQSSKRAKALLNSLKGTIDVGTVIKATTKVYKDASTDTEIETIDKGKTMNVSGFKNGFYEVFYVSPKSNKKINGYVSAGDVVVTKQNI